MKTSKFTIQSNQITLSKINLSNIYEKRLLNAFIDSLSPHLKGKIEEAKGINKGAHIEEQRELDLSPNKSVLYTYRLSDVEPNHQNYDRLRSAIKKLRQTDIDIVTSDGTEIYTGLIESAVLNPLSEFFQVKLSLTAYQFLCDISKGYSLKSFKTALELKNLYSSYIYDLICKWRNKPTFQIDLEELRFITNSPKSYSANDFKKRVLNSAKKELDSSDITDLTFNYEDIKKGRTIVGFRIHIFHTKNDTLTIKKLTKQISPNWDFEKPVIDYLNRNKINFNGVNRELLKKFFKLNGSLKGLDFLEKTKDTALRKARNNPQGYIIGAIKKHLEQKTEDSSKQLDILTEISKTKTV
jgi:plasmid replication initiation protein